MNKFILKFRLHFNLNLVLCWSGINMSIIPNIGSLKYFFNFDLLLTSSDLLWLLRSKCYRRCWTGIQYENKFQKLGPSVHFSNLTSFWPPVTSYDFWGQNTIDDVGQGYNMRINAKNWVPRCIIQIWPHFDLMWPPVTSDDFWGQIVIAYVGRGYHMSMYATNWVPEGIFKFRTNWS